MKPLEKSQLKNWREYIDYEIRQGDRQRIIFLFERCMVSCALYEDMWIKVCHYVCASAVCASAVCTRMSMYPAVYTHVSSCVY